MRYTQYGADFDAWWTDPGAGGVDVSEGRLTASHPAQWMFLEFERMVASAYAAGRTGALVSGRDGLKIVALQDGLATVGESQLNNLMVRLRAAELGSAEMSGRLERLEAAAHKFCDKVERGEARSRDSYGEFLEALGRKAP
jgi:hypothetical protein